jgi:Zn-dependent M28 family amino/carboxypeptidase
MVTVTDRPPSLRGWAVAVPPWIAAMEATMVRPKPEPSWEYQSGAKPTVSIDVKGVSNPAAPDYNLIAESKGGDKNHVVVVDAHLDAIYGAGILDNATGSAAILDIAEKMKNVTPRNKLRFIWFGGEDSA